MNVEAHHADDMGAIDRRKDALRPRQRAEFLRWQHHAGDRRDVAEEDDAGAGSDGVVEEIENLRSIFHGERQCDFLHHYAIALGFEVPGMNAAGMLLVSHEDLVARLHVDAISNVAISFSGITEKSNLIAIAADEGSQGIAKLVPGGVSPDGVVFGILLVHLLGGGVPVEDGAQYGCRAGADGAVIEIDLVLRDEELAAHLGPISVFVLIEQRRIGQVGGSLIELGQKASTESQGRGQSSGGGSEKAAAVEQGHLRVKDGRRYVTTGRRNPQGE